MPVFTDFSDLLPDPFHRIGDAGQSLTVAGNTAPGFSGLKMTNSYEVQLNRTRSGRGVPRSDASPYWSFSIQYNPMTKNTFDVVESFMLGHNTRLNPFRVILPNYSRPKNDAFYVFCQSNTIQVKGNHPAGANILTIDALVSISGDPKPGDFINIVDAGNINHTNTYKVTRVETNETYKTGTYQPAANERKIHIFPELQRAVNNNAVVRFIDPVFRVLQTSALHEVDLDRDNLYSYSFQVEEIQP